MEEQLTFDFSMINNWEFIPWKKPQGFNTWYLRYKDYCSVEGASYWVGYIYAYFDGSIPVYSWEAWLDGTAALGSVKSGSSATLKEAQAAAEAILRSKKPTNYIKRTRPWPTS
jgi:hypothetical protein